MAHPPKKIVRASSKEMAESRPKSPVKNAVGGPSTVKSIVSEGFKKASTVFGKASNVESRPFKGIKPQMEVSSALNESHKYDQAQRDPDLTPLFLSFV